MPPVERSMRSFTCWRAGESWIGDHEWDHGGEDYGDTQRKCCNSDGLVTGNRRLAKDGARVGVNYAKSADEAKKVVGGIEGGPFASIDRINQPEHEPCRQTVRQGWRDQRPILLDPQLPWIETTRSMCSSYQRQRTAEIAGAPTPRSPCLRSSSLSVSLGKHALARPG